MKNIISQKIKFFQYKKMRMQEMFGFLTKEARIVMKQKVIFYIIILDENK